MNKIIASPTKHYMETVKECAAARKRRVYVWINSNGNPTSTIHLSMVPYDTTYWVVSPSGAVIQVDGA